MNDWLTPEELKNVTKTKEKMWDELNGRTVRCLTVKNEGVQLFGVQDVENDRVYLLDVIR